MNDGVALRLAGVSVRFGPRFALREVDLDVRPGEVVALAGPNGSGKTTLIRAVLGLVPLDQGAIEILGDPLVSLSIRERARRVAWVPQEEGARDNVRLIDYVQYGRYSHRDVWTGPTSDDRAAVELALRSAGLADRAQDGILTLSGGERQRATLARTLAQETPILLLDEPTSHLDIGHQLDFLGRVRELARERRVAVIAALHDLNLAARYADRIVVLARGRRVAVGSPTEILSAELLAEVWGVDAELRLDPASGLPFLLPRRLIRAPTPGRRGSAGGPVHVVGGGGSAAPILRALTDAGFEVTTGALHLLDSDAETAEALGIVAAVEAPFAPLGPDARARNRELLAQARLIVVAPFPVGPSNLANLEDVRGFVPATPTFLLDSPGARLDFAGGAGTAAREALVAEGAQRVPDLATALSRISSALTAPTDPRRATGAAQP